MRHYRMYDVKQPVTLLDLIHELDEEETWHFNNHGLANILGSYQKKNDIDAFFDEYLYDFLGKVGTINPVFSSDTIRDEDGGWTWDASDLEMSLDGPVYWSKGFKRKDGVISFIAEGCYIEDYGDVKGWSSWGMEDETGYWYPRSGGEWESCDVDEEMAREIYSQIKSTTLDVPANTILPYTWDELYDLALKL